VAHNEVSDELWEEFHRVVNMTSRELSDWLRSESAADNSEARPDQSGDPVSREVVAILGKRRSDLTADDVAVMEGVVTEVRAARGGDREPTAGDDAWRRRLMSAGHDPLKPV
jgi:hypothetical protein